MSHRTSNSPDKNIVDRRKKRTAGGIFVKEIRQLATTSPTSGAAYEQELTFSFAENQRHSAWALPIFTAIVAAFASRYIGIAPAAIWFLMATLSSLLLTALSARYIRQADESTPPRKWRLTFVLAQLLVSACWTGFALQGCQSCQDDTFAVLQFGAVLIFQACAMMVTYGFAGRLAITSAPPTLALAARFALTYDPAHIAMACILLGSLGFFQMIAARFKRSVVSILEHKAEKETLIAELEMARSISEEARRRAEQANMAKSRFLATMSHELRTPLNAIMGFSEVMQAEVLGPIGNDSYKEYVNDIHNSGKHLLNVINEILDLSRIEAGRHELSEESVRLAHVVEDARHMLQLKAKNKGITISCHYEEGLPLIWADERAIRQVALNLLSNAVKFTPSGGTVQIKVGWTSGGGQYLSIKDSGPGIPEDEIPIVLSTFGQGSIAIKSAEQGTGLGLPIVQALMHMHDGRFELKSKLREGTECIATFPRGRVLEVMPPVRDNDPPPARPRAIRALRRAG